MAEILTIVRRMETESIEEFKARCCEVLRASDYPGAFAIGRFAQVGDKLEVSCLWGLAYPELPAETCYIASYSQAECRHTYLTFAKPTCPNCDKEVDMDEIIAVHNLAGDYHDECEYCV